MILRSTFLALPLLLLGLVPGAAQATLFNLAASIDCAQANAGAGTCAAGGSGTGSATITFDDATNQLTWAISWSGLSSPETVMHFHGPATTSQNAGIQVNFGGISGTTSPSNGSTAISRGQGADLLAELWYINIHTQAFPGGEIRGQVVPEPAGLAALVGAALAALAARRRGRG